MSRWIVCMWIKMTEYILSFCLFFGEQVSKRWRKPHTHSRVRAPPSSEHTSPLFGSHFTFMFFVEYMCTRDRMRDARWTSNWRKINDRALPFSSSAPIQSQSPSFRRTYFTAVSPHRTLAACGRHTFLWISWNEHQEFETKIRRLCVKPHGTNRKVWEKCRPYFFSFQIAGFCWRRILRIINSDDWESFLP